MLDGNTKSCGCLKSDKLAKRNYVHGQSGTKEYKAWKGRKRHEMKKLYDSEWTLEMEQVLRQLFPYCVNCGRLDEDNQAIYNRSLEVDHILPLSSGQGLRPGNATILCTSCNASKGNKEFDDLPKMMKLNLEHAAMAFVSFWKALQRGDDEVVAAWIIREEYEGR